VNPVLSIILVNYGHPDLTIECVSSLEKSSFKDFRVIIVDNGATIDSTDKLKRECAKATVISSAENLGFAEGNNVGIRCALETRSEMILLLNNDTIVDGDLLKNLVETAVQDDRAGIVGGKIYYYDDPRMIWFAGGHLEIDKALGTHVGIGTRDDGSFDVMKESDFITGCCLLAKREVFERIGLLDKKMFLYFEDADFCLRARKVGYTVLFQPKAHVYHKVSNSTQRESPLYLYFNLRNKILFLRKHSTLKKWLRNSPYLIYFYIRQFMRLSIKRHDLRAARAALLGTLDGLRNFTGLYGEGNLNRL
jgi:GT2 family glycosyltransferase